MPRPLKRYISGTVVEISSSVQRGLPLVPTMYMEVLIKGILAAAGHRYPFRLCHLIMMGNHFHLMGVVCNPADLKQFICYFKGQVAHAVNRLLGTSGSFWEAGSFSATILTPQDVLRRIAYIYVNPAKANLVSSIADYPGYSTFQHLIACEALPPEKCRRICRPAIPALKKGALSSLEDRALSEQLLDSAGYDYDLHIEPWAWLECFEECLHWNRETVLEELIAEIERDERAWSRQHNRPPIGAPALRGQDPRRSFDSRRCGVKTICICQDVEMRERFVSNFQADQKLARDCYKRWEAGELHLRPPPGFFAPGGMLLANTAFLSAIL